MKKKLCMLGIGLALPVIFLTGCEEPIIMYEGKPQKASVVEEILADKLEVENPDMDLEVDIYEETED